jgi:hypothetical protein
MSLSGSSLILPVINLLPLLLLVTYSVIVVMAIVMFAWCATNGVALCIITVCIVMPADYFM